MMVLWISAHMSLGGHVFLFLGQIPKSGISGSNGKFMFHISNKLPNCSPAWLLHFLFPQQGMRGFVSPHPGQHLVFPIFKILAILVGT